MHLCFPNFVKVALLHLILSKFSELGDHRWTISPYLSQLKIVSVETS